jgi:hypothetical protein
MSDCNYEPPAVSHDCDCQTAPDEYTVTISAVPRMDGDFTMTWISGQWWLGLSCGHLIREMTPEEVREALGPFAG